MDLSNHTSAVRADSAAERAATDIFPFVGSIGDPAIEFVSGTTALAIVCGLFAGLSVFMNSPVIDYHTWGPVLVVFDPALIQCVAFAHAVVCLGVWAYGVAPGHWLGTLSKSVLIVCTLLGTQYVINDLVYKPSFGRPRPPIEARLNVAVISSHFDSLTNGAPSGYTHRGVLLLIVSTLAALAQERAVGQAQGFRRLVASSLGVSLVQALLLALVASLRVVTGFHYWFDSLLGLTLGVFTSWLLILLVSATFGRVNHDYCERMVTPLFAITIAFSVVGFFYCRSAEAWAPAVLVAVVISLSTHLVATKRADRDMPVKASVEPTGDTAKREESQAR